MKKIVTSVIVVMVAGLAVVDTAAARRPELIAAPGVTLESSRSHWPIAREASGQWGIVGEAIARHYGGAPVTVTSIVFSILDERRRVLALETFDTPERLSSVLLISRPTSTAAPDWKPLGTNTLEPGDTAVAFLANLTDSRLTPAAAQITMRFDRAPAKTLLVDLTPFTPRPRMLWPLRLGGTPWMTINTAGTVHHWWSSTVFAKGAVLSSQRFALDILGVDASGESHSPDGIEKESYYIWGEDVFSSASGRVVAVVSDRLDHEIGESILPGDTPGGNFVVIQHGPRLFSVYAHMQQASAIVAVGDVVEAGQPIGRVGNSGDSTQPHLHVHFTDAWLPANTPFESFVLSQGVPAVYWGAQVYRDGVFFDLNGSSPLEFDVVVRGDDQRP